MRPVGQDDRVSRRQRLEEARSREPHDRSRHRRQAPPADAVGRSGGLAQRCDRIVSPTPNWGTPQCHWRCQDRILGASAGVGTTRSRPLRSNAGWPRAANSRSSLFTCKVRNLLAQRIAGGVWPPGSMLPNEMELARELGVSSGTVRKALDILESDRLVLRRQGRGTSVVDQATGDVAARFSNIRDGVGRRIVGDMELLAQTQGRANEDRAGALAAETPASPSCARRACDATRASCSCTRRWPSPSAGFRGSRERMPEPTGFPPWPSDTASIWPRHRNWLTLEEATPQSRKAARRRAAHPAAEARPRDLRGGRAVRSNGAWRCCSLTGRHALSR